MCASDPRWLVAVLSASVPRGCCPGPWVGAAGAGVVPRVLAGGGVVLVRPAPGRLLVVSGPRRPALAASAWRIVRVAAAVLRYGTVWSPICAAGVVGSTRRCRDPLRDKENAAATFKGTYGFHPMMCFADATGETLAAVLRPGNAGANTVTDHLDVLDQAVAQLPAGIALGHRNGDDPTGVSRRVVVRADAAGCTEGFLGGCRARNIGFYVSARRNTGVHAAILDAVGVDVWLPALGRDREPRDDGAVVAELTSLIDDPKLPAGTRLIVRREPLHPGAQRSLFPSMDYRYWGFYTDQPGDPRDLDATSALTRTSNNTSPASKTPGCAGSRSTGSSRTRRG
ncbi:MAG: transposase [Microthrixaceae bacterium]